MSKNIEVFEAIPVMRKNPTVVTGFAGPGFIGNTAAMYIIRGKGFKMKAYVESTMIPPMLMILEGRPEHAIRIYGSEEDDFFFIVSEIMLTTENAWRIGYEIMEWLKDKGVREVVLIEGMPISLPRSDSVVFGFSEDRDMAKYNIQRVTESAVLGINASIIDWCIKHKVSWSSLFVPTNMMASIDFKGAVAVIEALNRMFKFGVDTSLLIKRYEAFRQAAEAKKEPKPGLLGRIRGSSSSNPGLASD
ncbi:MAG: proteasome assembly chaperone family protein [Candidatus Bathyarchaeia archaeon]